MLESANSLVESKYLIGLDTDKIGLLMHNFYKDKLIDYTTPIYVNEMQVLSNSVPYTGMYRIAVRLWSHWLLWQLKVLNSNDRLKDAASVLNIDEFRKRLIIQDGRMMLTVPFNVFGRNVRTMSICLSVVGYHRIAFEIQFESSGQFKMCSVPLKDLSVDDYEVIASELINIAFCMSKAGTQSQIKFLCPMTLEIYVDNLIYFNCHGYDRLSPHLLYSSKFENSDSITARDVKSFSKTLLDKLRDDDDKRYAETRYTYTNHVDVSDIEYIGTIVNTQLLGLNLPSMTFTFDDSSKKTYVIYSNGNKPIGLRHITGLKVAYGSGIVYNVALNLVQSKLDLGPPSMSLNLEALLRKSSIKPTIIADTYVMEQANGYFFRVKDGKTDAGLVRLMQRFIQAISDYKENILEFVYLGKDCKFNCRDDLDKLSSSIFSELSKRAAGYGISIERIRANVLYRTNIEGYTVVYKTGISVELGSFKCGLTIYIKPKRNSKNQKSAYLLQLSLDTIGIGVDDLTLRVYTGFPIKQDIFNAVGLDIYINNIFRYILSKQPRLGVNAAQGLLSKIVEKLFKNNYFDDMPNMRNAGLLRYVTLHDQGNNSVEVVCITGVQVTYGYVDAMLGVSLSIDVSDGIFSKTLGIGFLKLRTDDVVEKLTKWWLKVLDSNTDISVYGQDIVAGIGEQINALSLCKSNLSKERAFRIGTIITKCLEDKIVDFSNKGIITQLMHSDWNYKTTLRYSSDSRITGINRRNDMAIKYKRANLCNVVVDMSIPDKNEEVGSYKIYLSLAGNDYLETCCSYTVNHFITDDRTVILEDIVELLKLFYDRLVIVTPLESKGSRVLSGLIGKHGAFDVDRRVGSKIVKEFRAFIKDVLSSFNESYKESLLVQTMDGRYAYKTDKSVITVLGVGAYLELVYFDDDVSSGTSSCYYLIKLVTNVGDCLLKYIIYNESVIPTVNSKFIEVAKAMRDFGGTLDDYIMKFNGKLEQWARNNNAVSYSYIMGFFNYIAGSGITAEAFLAVLNTNTYAYTCEKSRLFDPTLDSYALPSKYISWIEYFTRQPNIVSYLTEDDMRAIEKGFIKFENLAYN